MMAVTTASTTVNANSPAQTAIPRTIPASTRRSLENSSRPVAVNATANRSQEISPAARTTGEAATHIPSQV